MLKSALTTLCRSQGCRFIFQQQLDSCLVLRVQQLHLTGCHQVLDKDHPLKKAAEKFRKEQEDVNVKPISDVEMAKQGPILDSLFPTLETHAMLINGTRYDELPIIHIQATRNNTIVTATDYKGNGVALTSGGSVGFRNARKGTNVAAQAAAMSLVEKVKKKGINLVRVCVKGIGPGRLPALKALELSGMTIVSITDTTILSHGGNRPKKQRRI